MTEEVLSPSILLAEDNPADVFLIRMALEEHDVKLHLEVVTNGEEALSWLRSLSPQDPLRRPAVIVLDLNLPMYDGGEVLRYIRSREDLDQVQVAILTSSDSPRDRTRLEEMGSNCYIRKPSSLDEFMAIGAVLKDRLATPGDGNQNSFKLGNS